MVVIVRCFNAGGCVHCAYEYKMLVYFMENTTAWINEVSLQSNVNLDHDETILSLL